MGLILDVLLEHIKKFCSRSLLRRFGARSIEIGYTLPRCGPQLLALHRLQKFLMML
ncbi:MAG: hypothetical protein K2W99_04470 [Chthoniobacterales bacterium]|nr:hypothetical protein [Chthoniobacterales bacterium]